MIYMVRSGPLYLKQVYDRANVLAILNRETEFILSAMKLLTVILPTSIERGAINPHLFQLNGSYRIVSRKEKYRRRFKIHTGRLARDIICNAGDSVDLVHNSTCDLGQELEVELVRLGSHEVDGANRAKDDDISWF